MVSLSLYISIMGNCIGLRFSTSQRLFNGGEEEFMVSTPVEQITLGPYHGYKLVHRAQPYSPFPLDSKLISGEACHLIPRPILSGSRLVSQKVGTGDGCRDRCIKVVVTKKQLKELLLRSGAKIFPFEEFSIHVMENFRVREGCRRWRPSLATIPESRIC